MKAIAKRTATKVKPTDLTALAAKILRAHAEARQAAVMIVEKAIEAGDALLKAKEQLGHGEWLPWLEASCPDISVRTVQVYMRLAKKRDTIAQMRNAAHLPIREAVAFLAKPRFWVADPAGSEEIEEAEEDEDGFHAILYQPIGMRFDERKCKTKAGAERIAEEWREHIAGLERKPSGEVCVVTAEKLDAMGWSCAVTPHTTQAEDAAIVADAKGEGKVAKPWKPRESPLRLAPFRKKGEREELKGEAMGILHRLGRDKTRKLVWALGAILRKCDEKWIDEEGKGTSHRPKEQKTKSEYSILEDEIIEEVFAERAAWRAARGYNK